MGFYKASVGVHSKGYIGCKKEICEICALGMEKNIEIKVVSTDVEVWGLGFKAYLLVLNRRRINGKEHGNYHAYVSGDYIGTSSRDPFR